jgi:thiosulfate/3-mercaptopyruvate sulfurtransferase
MSLLKSKLMQISIICGALLAIVALSQSAYAGAECASLGGACDDGGWSGAAKLDEIGEPTDSQSQSAAKWPEKSREMRWNMSASASEYEEKKASETSENIETSLTTQNVQNTTLAKKAEDPASIMRSNLAKAILVPLDAVTDADILLDVSENSSTHIAGSVVIPYMEFDVQAGSLKSIPEISKILGDAGISHNDSVVIYGECLPCGGGPSLATYVYRMMKELGHEKVKVLDGTVEDWAASGRKTSNESQVRPGKVYSPGASTNFAVTYEFVKSGQAQILDARTMQEYGSGNIPGSINIPYENVLEGKKIKDEALLKKIFATLSKDRPVVVYTNTGMKASVVWFALVMMGYDAKVYAWQNWLESQPKFNFELANVEAKPNPVMSGSTTTITASFREKQKNTAGNSSEGEIKLTVKGCSTCGFEGFSLGATGATGNNSEMVRLGSSGKSSASNEATAKAEDSALRCIAIIYGDDGGEVARASLLLTSGYNYVGIWNANVPPGIYKVSISASASSGSETFADVLEIEVTG